MLLLLRRDEILDDFHHEVSRQAMKIHLGRMLDPMSLPVVVHLRVQHLVLVVDALGEKLLQPLVLGERDVRTFIKRVFALITKRRRVPAVVRLLIEENPAHAGFAQLVRRAVTSHARA